ncbi:MAG: hypothetical protein ACLFS9_02585 [Nitriliruptoraceae bacterium]
MSGAPTPVPVTLRSRLQLAARRLRLGPFLIVAVVALVLGGLVGRSTAPGSEDDAVRALEASVLPVALDADGIWTSSTESRPAVSEVLVTLRQGGDPDPVLDNLEGWLAAYDQALVRLAAADVPPAARAVQRQLIAAVALSRDAVEVLGHAATVEDDLHRRDLTTEVGRLRDRAEQLTASARASLSDLDGTRTDMAPLPALRGFHDGRE